MHSYGKIIGSQLKGFGRPIYLTVSQCRQETAEDGKVGLSQFDLVNRQYVGKGQSYHINLHNLLLVTFKLSFKFVPLFFSEILLQPETLIKC